VITRRDWWIGVALVSLAIVVHAVAPCLDWRVGNGEQRPLRVWVEASETYKNVNPRSEVFEKKTPGAVKDVEQTLQRDIGFSPGCIVLTRNKQTADRLVSISVSRYLDGGDVAGDADVVIAKRNGDILLTESFRQSSNPRDCPDSDFSLLCHEDIGDQPVEKVWQTLCGPPAPVKAEK
jgi:hypothetical protein